jgi:tRNA pseudouridine38-40 synthase
VANFKTDCPIPCENLVKALNDALPSTVRVKDAQEVSVKFHARYDVRSKTYRYRILLAPVCSPFLWRFVWHYPFSLEVDRMVEAAELFEGEHDFTSFAAVDGSTAGETLEDASQNRNPPRRNSGSGGRQAARKIKTAMVRRVFASRIFRHPRTSMLIYEVSGNGFLRHMVRNMVGTLVEVGRGKLEPSDIIRILQARNRTVAGPTAPAQGLCLVEVEY